MKILSVNERSFHYDRLWSQWVQSNHLTRELLGNGSFLIITDYIRLSGVIYIRQAYKLGFCLFLCSTIQNRSDISIKMEVIAVYRTITIDDSLQWLPCGFLLCCNKCWDCMPIAYSLKAVWADQTVFSMPVCDRMMKLRLVRWKVGEIVPVWNIIKKDKKALINLCFYHLAVYGRSVGRLSENGEIRCFWICDRSHSGTPDYWLFRSLWFIMIGYAVHHRTNSLYGEPKCAIGLLDHCMDNWIMSDQMNE